jgi:3-hydroxybutyryl-CoA dehydrogenase
MAIDVQRVLVVGGGTMGTGIAQVAARAGYRTEIYDVVGGAAQRSLERVGESLSRAVEKGRCSAEEREQAPSTSPSPATWTQRAAAAI